MTLVMRWLPSASSAALRLVQAGCTNVSTTSLPSVPFSTTTLPPGPASMVRFGPNDAEVIGVAPIPLRIAAS